MKHEVRASILNWKLSVKCRNDSDQTFVNNVFKELDNLIEMVYHKHDGSVPNRVRECHKIVDVWPMTESTIVRMHTSGFLHQYAHHFTAIFLLMYQRIFLKL